MFAPWNRGGVSTFLSSVLISVACGQEGIREAPSGDPARPGNEITATSDAVAEYMVGHFVEVTEAQKAVIQGHLDAVGEPARAVVERQPLEELPKGWEPFVGELQSAAWLAIEAKNLQEAASATATMVWICGACHQGVGVDPRVPELGTRGTPPGDELDTVPHMRRHDWAVRRMWVGLINPSDEAWNEGCKGLADAPLEPQKITGQTNRIGEAARRVHELGAKAAEVRDWKSRAEVYGDLLGTCAGCHWRLGVSIELE